MRTTMIAAALMAAATPALAATLGQVPVSATRVVRGTLDAPGPQKWSLTLRRGQLYAISAAYGENGSFSVHAAGGRTLVSITNNYDDNWHGANFVAPYTGSYIVQVACTPDGCPGLYEFGVQTDCSGDAGTSCRIGVGQTLHGLGLFGEEDVDWRAVALRAGRTYRISASSGGREYDALCLALLDGRGKQVVAEDCANSPALTFAPAASGTYFIQTRQGDGIAPGVHSLTVR